jgi:hypothetical protein
VARVARAVIARVIFPGGAVTGRLVLVGNDQRALMRLALDYFDEEDVGEALKRAGVPLEVIADAIPVKDLEAMAPGSFPMAVTHPLRFAVFIAVAFGLLLTAIEVMVVALRR